MSECWLVDQEEVQSK